MSLRRYVPLWWMPLLLTLTPTLGLMPAHRDLIDFFLPMRTATASSIATGVMPWLNMANGCGESWFANPETAVFYPPAWVHLVATPEWALAAEIGLHLAWLSLGAGLVARHLGSGPTGRSVVEVAAWSVGPIVFTVGVLNNLETLAWVPWMVLAARAVGLRSIGMVAAATAFAWLGGEPQLWAMAVVLTLWAARSRSHVVAGLILGSLAVAFQMVPFIFWVFEGDRGPQAASWVLRGAIHPTDWGGLLVPGLSLAPDRMIYMESLFLGAPLLVCGILGVWRRRWIAFVVIGLGFLATLPALGGGGIFLALTGGLVRYPSRFALAGLALLVPMIGHGVGAWLDGRGRWLALCVASVTLVLCATGWHPLRWWVAGIPAGLMLPGAVVSSWRGLRGAALLAGVIGVIVAALPLVGLRPVATILNNGRTWPEAADDRRIYTPAPSQDAMPWLAAGLERRRLWPVGYLNLTEGLTLTRTDSPVANGRLMKHLEMADRGPENRWWLDTLAARWVILREAASVPEDMDSVRVRDGMRLLRNHRAFPPVHLDSNQPRPDLSRRPDGRVVDVVSEPNELCASLDVTSDGYAWISLAPIRGWRWTLDGARVELEQGPGIVQFLPVAKGRHELVGRYRPPGIVPAAITSLVAVILVFVTLLAPMHRFRREDGVVA